MIPPVTNEIEAEAYAAKWYRGELETQPLLAIATAESTNLDIINGGTTFEAFGAAWTSGKLAARFPDHVKRKSSSKQDASRLKNYVYALIGAEPVVAFEGRAGLELVERVVAGPSTSRTDISPRIASTGAPDCAPLADTCGVSGEASVRQSAPQGLRPQGDERQSKIVLVPRRGHGTDAEPRGRRFRRGSSTGSSREKAYASLSCLT